MLFIHTNRIIAILVLICVVNCEKDAKLAQASTSDLKVVENPKDNNVLVHFMDFKRSEFLEILPDVKKAIANSLNEFCTQEKCYEQFNQNFTANDINFYGNTDKEKFTEEGRFIVTKLFVKIPTESDAADDQDESKDPSAKPESEEHVKVLSSGLLEEFLGKHRGDISKEANAEIAFLNNKLIYPQRNNLDNWIIVSISCGFCVVLIIVNIVCQSRSNKKIREELVRKAKERERELKPLIRKRDDDFKSTTSIRSEQPSENKSKRTSLRQNSVSNEPNPQIKPSNGTKRKKKSDMSNSNSLVIAGHVGSGIGSPRTLNTIDDSNWFNRNMKNSTSADIINSDFNNGPRRQMNHSNSNYSVNRNYRQGDVQIPIERSDRYERHYDVNQFPDPRVAYRLASTENLL